MQHKSNTFRNLTRWLWILLLGLSLLPAQAARADTGPKPTMEFSFKQEASGDPLTIVSGILYECDKADCSDASPLKQLGPQGLRCDELGCNALAYGFRDYHKLEIQFSDGKTRQSNIFKTAGFESKYTVTIRPDDLVVEPQFSLVPSTRFGVIGLIACLCGLIITVLVIGGIVFFVRRARTP
jgi:hypothetical protein